MSSDNESSDINNIEKSSSILQNQNAAESRHKSRDKTSDLADHPNIIYLTKLANTYIVESLIIERLYCSMYV